MPRFNEFLERSVEDIKAKSVHTFEAKVTNHVFRYYGFKGYADKSEVEYCLNLFHEIYPSFPVRLEARNIKVSVERMFSAMTKTDVWKLFLSYLDENSLQYAAFIIPCYGQSLFCFHNCWHLNQMPGVTRLTRMAATSEKGIIFEPLDAFLESVRKAGWSP